jgi:2'-5' RNA ligase
MPWHLEYGNAECGDDQWAVVKVDNGAVEGCHPTRADAVSQMQALYANEPEAVVVEEPLAAAAVMDGAQTGAMVALVPSEADAERLALEGYEAADQLHCTVTFLGKADQYDDVRRKEIISEVATAVGGLPPVAAQAFGVAAFNPAGDDPCLVLQLGGPELANAGALIGNRCDMYAPPDAHKPWVPHITLGYDADPYMLMGDDTTERLGPVTFDRVRVAFAGEIVDIPLSADPQPVDEPVDDGAAIVAAMMMGTPFRCVIVPEGVWSGDDRMWAEGSGDMGRPADSVQDPVC